MCSSSVLLMRSVSLCAFYCNYQWYARTQLFNPFLIFECKEQDAIITELNSSRVLPRFLQIIYQENTMSSILEKAVELQNSISLAGNSGVNFQTILKKFGIEERLGFYIAKQFLTSSGYIFKLGLTCIDLDSYSLDSFIEAVGDTICFAPVEAIKRACGIECANMIPGEENSLCGILEAIAKAETKGCLMSELSSLAGSQVHNSIDRLVGLDILVKRSVNPVAGSGPSRISSKSTVVHGKKFAPYYDEASDGVRVIVSSSYLDKIHELILFMLQQRNAKMMPVRDLAHALGMSRWDMQALRNASIAQEKKEPAKVKFFLVNCQSYGPDGILSVPRLAWCVGSATDASLVLDEGDSKMTFQCSRNLPLHETIALTLASRPEGLTASDLRALTGISLKRAAKLFTAFNKQFGYPVEKVQDGKQLKHKLLPKDLSQAQAQMDRISSSKAAHPTVTSVAAVQPNMITASSSRMPSALPASAAASVEGEGNGSSATAATSAAREDKKSALVSDMQALNNSIILDFLTNSGGVASTADIVAEVRLQHRRIRQQQLLSAQSSFGSASNTAVSGASSNVDRRTIDRTLQRLEQNLHSIISFPALLPAVDAADSEPGEEKDTLVLVALAGMDDEHRQHAVDEYLQRRFINSASNGTDGNTSVFQQQEEPLSVKKQPTERSVKRRQASSAAASSSSKALKKRRTSSARAAVSDDSDSASNYSDDELSQSSPHTSSDDDDSDSGGDVAASGQEGKILGTAGRKRRTSAATHEVLAAAPTSCGVDQRLARHNALHQKKVMHDEHIFDGSNLLLAPGDPQGHESGAEHVDCAVEGVAVLGGLAEAQSPGFLIHCLLFHNFLQGCVLRTMSAHAGTGGEHRTDTSRTVPLVLHAGEQIEVVLPALLVDFPVHYFLRTSAALRKSLVDLVRTNPDRQQGLLSEIEKAVGESRTCREIFESDSPGHLKDVLKQYLSSPACRAEHVAVLGGLAAFGIVRPAQNTGAGELDAIMCAMQERAGLVKDPSAHTQARATGVKAVSLSGAVAASTLDMGTYVELVTLLRLGDCCAALVEDRLSAALQQVYEQPHSLNPVPVGAWAQLKSELDVYHHWLSVILPSLPISWEGIRTLQDMTSMTHLGRHALHYFEVEKGVTAALAANAEQEGYFNNKMRMTYWGSPQLRQAWGEKPADTFSWEDLLPGGLPAPPPDADDAIDASSGGAPIFSLDMPRRAGSAQHTKKRAPAEASAASSAAAGSARKKARTSDLAAAVPQPQPQPQLRTITGSVRIDAELHRIEKSLFCSEDEGAADGTDKGGDMGGDSAGGMAVESEQEKEAEATWGREGEGDSQLDEEVRGLHDLDEVEWTAKQIAIILEVVLVKFLAKRHGARSSALAADTSGATDLSCFDCNWAETDFSLVSEIFLNASIAASRVPDQKVAKNRLLQCIKYRPRLLSVVAWVLCNKGSQLSSSLSGILNTVLRAEVPREGPDRRAALTTMLQTYASPGLSKQGLQALQSHSLDTVRAVTKELLQIGFLKKCEHCGSERCAQKPGPCKHNKRAFDLTEAFYESQSDSLLAPYYLDCLMGGLSREGTDATATAPGSTSATHVLLEELHLPEASPSFKVLAVSQFLCSRPAALACKLELLSPEEQVQAGAAGSMSSVLGVELESPAKGAAVGSTEEVLLMSHDGTGSSGRGEAVHSGFCEKPLNTLVHCDVTAALPSHLPTSNRSSDAPGAGESKGLLQCAADANTGSECSVPWLLLDGTVNVALLCGLASKVLSTLAERPGAPAPVIHTALCILSAAQTTQLLEVLQRAHLVEERVARADTQIADPFQSAAVLRRAIAAKATGHAGYFVVNSC